MPARTPMVVLADADIEEAAAAASFGAFIRAATFSRAGS